MKVLLLGDCLKELKSLRENSIDSIVTDPPYGLSFMNKKWDYDVPSIEIWTECLRVLKPGGHLLSFSGSRTYHRMAVRIEDAGFDIRDQIMWIYGSGFPKSHNIGKAVDKLQGNEREVVGIQKLQGTAVTLKGKPNRENWYDQGEGGTYTSQIELTKGTSEWEGWGTALKPAHEPIVVARKPLSEKSVAENVLKWGTGGMNIDVSRIGTDGGTKRSHQSEYPKNEDGTEDRSDNWSRSGHNVVELNEGRWPANIILDEGEEPWRKFFYCPKASKKDRDEGMDGFEDKEKTTLNSYGDQQEHLSSDGSIRKGNKGTTISKNNHPTVKPTELMLYLIKLVTPKGGTVLDPFMGSGSTGKAAIRGGFDFVGIEKEEEYIKIAEARINNEKK